MENQNRRSQLADELADVRAENRRLKESNRLENTIAALKAENSRLNRKQLEDQLEAARSENRRLIAIRTMEAAVSSLRTINDHLTSMQERTESHRRPELQTGVSTGENQSSK